MLFSTISSSAQGQVVDFICAAALKELCLQQVCTLGPRAQQLMCALRGGDNLVSVTWRTYLCRACKPANGLIVIAREHDHWHGDLCRLLPGGQGVHKCRSIVIL